MGSKVIRVEDKKHFYNDTPSLALDNVDGIKWSYDKNHIFKSIAIGYQKWSAESSGGIDDPQTKKTYASLFYQIGQNITLMSKFFAAALAIEQTRRNRVEETKDWRLDEDIMIIALTETISPSYYSPELNENFTNITGINNSNSRYNLRLTPAWNFLRWIYFFRGCLQDYTDSEFKFTHGEGNYDFAATMDDDSDCILFTEPVISENGNIAVDIDGASGDFLHLADQWEFDFKLSWEQYKTIRNNRKNAIEVSQTDENHTICHINSLEWKPFNSMANFKVWLGGRTGREEPIEEPEASPPAGETGDFILDPAYGLSITGLVGTDIPSFTFPVTSQTSLSFSATVPAQTFQVSLNGTRFIPIDFNITLYVDSIAVDCSLINSDGVQTHFLTLPASVSVPSDIRISIGTGGC